MQFYGNIRIISKMNYYPHARNVNLIIYATFVSTIFVKLQLFPTFIFFLDNNFISIQKIIENCNSWFSVSISNYITAICKTPCYLSSYQIILKNKRTKIAKYSSYILYKNINQLDNIKKKVIS